MTRRARRMAPKAAAARTGQVQRSRVDAWRNSCSTSRSAQFAGRTLFRGISRALAQHYDPLTPWERVPLILAATGRGDYLEEERLSRSAPKLSYLIPDHYCLG